MFTSFEKLNLYIGRTPQLLEQLKSDVDLTKQEIDGDASCHSLGRGA
jgi:hypothetical protein